MKYVLINYNTDCLWVKEYTDDILIYDRSSTNDYIKEFYPDQVIKRPNLGNVDWDRLSYICDNYDNLPDVFLLAKSNLFNYISKEEFELVKDNKIFTPLLTQNHKVYEPICRYVDSIYEEINNSWYAPQFNRNYNTYNDWAMELGLPTPEYLQFAPGGNYILTKEVIHRYPKEFYAKIRDMLPYAQLPAEAHYCERAYYTLWK